ncbi:unnamed protein product [Pedinophyceae sp. YPF-701]|nr:unnamed protein product [Pedinophyceae sp. YPF-701]
MILRLVSKVGDGGYSQVFLAREVEVDGSLGARMLAVKKVLCQTNAQLDMAKSEMAAMRRLKGKEGCLELLAGTIVPSSGEDLKVAKDVALFVFPYYPEGTLVDFLARRAKAEGAGPRQPMQARLTPLEAACVVLQVARAVAEMHALDQPLTHRDIKPLNVLVRAPPGARGATDSAAPAAASTSSWRHAAPRSPAPMEREMRPLRGGGGAPAADPRGGPASAEAQLARASGLTAVLMDFGSVGAREETIATPQEARLLQDHAAAHSTAPYRAPELFEPPCIGLPVTMDVASADVWSLGCLIFFCLTGESPFEHSLREGGGSIALAVLAGHVRWPEECGSDAASAELQNLAEKCLVLDRDARPSAAQVASEAASIIQLVMS